MQSQKAVTAYFSSKPLLPFGLAERTRNLEHDVPYDKLQPDTLGVPSSITYANEGCWSSARRAAIMHLKCPPVSGKRTTKIVIGGLRFNKSCGRIWVVGGGRVLGPHALCMSKHHPRSLAGKSAICKILVTKNGRICVNFTNITPYLKWSIVKYGFDNFVGLLSSQTSRSSWNLIQCRACRMWKVNLTT